MSGKFMNVKKLIIPTITMVIIASQLMGCAAVSQSELLRMINAGDQIEIEVAVPINQEDGEEVTVDWTRLDQLLSQPELRKEMDDIYKIIAQGDSKNGVFYVNLEGNQEGNNTLFNVFANRTFRTSYWENESIQEVVAEASAENYADIEVDTENYDRAVLAAFNAYFNILNDSEPGYANMDSTISRLEAMAAIFKAEYPVTDTITQDADFNVAIGADSSNEYAFFASNLSEQSYLTVDSGSLDSYTANGTITRGELIYMLVQKYFSEEYDAVDVKTSCYSDTKNGGDIATAQKFIEKGTAKEGWQAYELTYALQNPDKGCPERMYKALVVAYNNGILNGSESRWDEGVTKGDFLEILTNTYLALPAQISADKGIMTEYDTTIEDENQAPDITTESNGGSITTEYEKAPETLCTFEDIEDTTLYATVAGSFFYDPNFIAAGEADYDGTLIPTGSYEAQLEYTFTHKTVYNGTEYLSFTNKDGLVMLAKASDFSATKIEDTASQEQTNDNGITTRPATEQEKQDAADTRAQEEQALRDMGFTDEQIDAYFNGGSGIPIVTPESSSGGAPQSPEDWLQGIPEDLLNAADGVQTH